MAVLRSSDSRSIQRLPNHAGYRLARGAGQGRDGGLFRMSSSPSDPNYVPPLSETGGKPAPHPKRAAHLAIFLTVLIDLIGFGILIPIIQPFAQRFGASDLQAAWLVGTYSLMQFVFSPILGRISDRVGRRPVIIASLIGSMLGYLIIAGAEFAGGVIKLPSKAAALVSRQYHRALWLASQA